MMQDVMGFIRSKGVSVSVEGNKPILITDPGEIWVVESGKVAVFCVQVKGSRFTGARDFVFEAGPGQALLGLLPEDNNNKKYGLLVSGWPGTSLLKVKWPAFLEFAEQDPLRDIALTMLNSWAGYMVSLIDLEDDPVVKFTEYPGVQVELKQAGQIKVFNLEDFGRFALESMIGLRQKRREEERRQLEKKRKKDLWFMENTIKVLASAARRESVQAAVEEELDDPLIQACRLVGKATKIDIIKPPQYTSGEARDLLENIASYSRFRVRKVELTGEWYKEDHGPMLAYIDDDGRPVALIPKSPSEYLLKDPLKKTETSVTRELAQQMRPDAFSFYRTFPSKPLNLKDILTFGLESCWKRDLLFVILMGLAGGALGMVIPIATGIVIDTVIPGGERIQLWHVAAFLGASAVASLLFQITRSLAMQRLEVKIDGSVQAAVWDRLLSLPAPFFKNYTSGELALRALGITLIRKILSGALITSIVTSFFSLFNLGLLFYYDSRLAGIAMSMILIGMAVTVIFLRWQLRYQQEIVDLSNKIGGTLLEVFSGITKIIIAGAEKRMLYLVSKKFSLQRKSTNKMSTIIIWLSTFNSIFPVIVSIVLFYSVSALLINNPLGTGKFVAFNSAMVSFMMAFVMFTQSLSAVNSTIPMYERLKPIIEALPEYDEGKMDAGELTGSIEVSHIFFRYSQEGPLVLEDVSFQVEKGEYIGIVGASGSGKSTLFRILLGFEKPLSGQIFYNGQPLEKVDVRSVRRQLGVVLQNGQLMSGSFFSNITGANSRLTMDDAWEAARMVGLDRDIQDMPMGMHTVISEGMSTISGGQKQRLMIARAIVNRPKIIYFDEATSALDNKTQSIVSDSLDKLKATRVVIAHRLSTVIKCDRIIVMDKGKIIETGTYNELMQQGGLFSQLASRQLA